MLTLSSLPQRLMQLPGWCANILALIVGALLPLSFSPFFIWPIGLFSAAIFALLVHPAAAGRAFIRSFCFGIGLYGVGVSWVYVSIHFYGGASAFLAALLTLIFVSFLALVFSLPFYC